MTTYSLFNHASAGGTQSTADSNEYTLGVEFYVTQSGCTLTQIHFYWGTTGATTNHECRLYTVDAGGTTGTLVTGTSKVFPQPFVNGWNTVTLDSPVALTANQKYRAGVHFTTADGYTATSAYWTTGAGASGITSGPLTGPSNAAALGNIQGSFHQFGDAFPESSFGGSNYWIDVTIDDGGGGATATPAKVSDRGSVANITAAATSPLTLTSPTAIAVGNYLIARVAVDNSGSSGAAPGCTVTDARNTWTVLGPALVDPGAASAGATAYLCYAKVATAYQAADTITFNWGGVSTTAKAIVVEEWSNIHLTSPVAVSAVTNSGTGTALSVAITPTAANQLVYACCAVEGPSTDSVTYDSDTTNGSWAAVTPAVTASGTATNNQITDGQYKIVNAAGAQTWNLTITSRDWAALAVVFAPKPINAGTGAGTYAYVGASAGKRTPKGTGAGAYAYAGAAAGKKTQKGTGAGTYAYVGAASGDAPPNSGAASGAYAYVGAATGKRTPKAAGAGAYAYAGAATGKRTTASSGAGSFAYVGAAAGKRVAGAIGAGTYSYAGAASGTAPSSFRTGSGAGSYAYAGAASGKRPAGGTAAGVYAYAGAASGKRVAAATAAGSYAYAGSAVGKRVPKGASATGGGFGQDPFGSLPFGWGPNVYHYEGAALTAPAPGQGAGAGSYQYTGAASGKRAPKATGPGAYSYAGAGTGKRTPKAQTAGTYAYVGAATGVRPVVNPKTGTGAGSWTYSGAATGKRIPKATGSSSYTYIGFGSTTSVHRAIGVGSWQYAGASMGKRAPKAVAPGAWQYAGAAVGSTALRGSGAGSWTYDGFALGSQFPFVAFGEEFFGFL